MAEGFAQHMEADFSGQRAELLQDGGEEVRFHEGGGSDRRGAEAATQIADIGNLHICALVPPVHRVSGGISGREKWASVRPLESVMTHSPDPMMPSRRRARTTPMPASAWE